MSNPPFDYKQFEHLSLADKAKVADVYDVAHDFRIDFARMNPDEFKAKVDEYLKVASVEYWHYSLDLRGIRDIQRILNMDDPLDSIPF